MLYLSPVISQVGSMRVNRSFVISGGIDFGTLQRKFPLPHMFAATFAPLAL
jgi:hypothetical protein